MFNSITKDYQKEGSDMIFKLSFIESNELLFFIFLSIIVFMIGLTILFVIKEMNDTK